MTMTYEIATRSLTKQFTAVMRGEMPAERMAAWMPKAFRAVHEYLLWARVTPVGPPFARFTFLDDVVAVEAGFPVAFEVQGDGIVEPSALPGCRAAVTTHVGPYESLDRAYRAVTDWLADHAYHPVGPHWEVYHSNPATEPDPTTWRTDVIVPFRT